MTLFLGKAPAQPGLVTFKFTDFARVSQMPEPPANFGRSRLIKRGKWGMMGNDRAGDCVFAAAGHNTLLWNAEAARRVDISDATVLNNYGAFTGYQANDPSTGRPWVGDNPTDQGTVMGDWLKAWRTQGFRDDHGNAHRIGAYLSLDPGNLDQLRYAAYYFDGVMLGVNFPQQWMDMFDQGGRVWPALKTPNYVGGHCITAVDYRDKRPYAITWGTGVELTTQAIEQTCDEAYAILTPEKLRNGLDLNGFDMGKLTDYIKALKGVK